MDQSKAIELGDAAMDRELRADTVGYFAGGTFVLDSTRIFFWFDTADDLVDYLIEAEPYIYDLQTPEREAYQTRIREILVSRDGLPNEKQLSEINGAWDRFLGATVEWIGTFGSLCSDDSEFSKNMRCSYRLSDFDEDRDDPLSPEEIEGFVEYVRHCGI